MQSPKWEENGMGDYENKFKEGSMHPEFMNPGLEPVPDQYDGKEVVENASPGPDSQTGLQHGDSPERRICGLRRVIFLLLLLLGTLIVLGIALGVGLGVGLNNSSPSSSSSAVPSSTPQVNTQHLIGGSINSSYYTTSGTFNGTGIALASQSFANQVSLTTDGDVVIYFQSYDREIRFIELDGNGDWVGGTQYQLVANNARNNTPITAVSYNLNGTSTWHIFYIDTANQIRQKTNSNTTQVWMPGPLDSANLIANDEEQVSLLACWYGNDYGDSGYSHSPLPPGRPGAAFSNDVGMNLWYAKDNTTLEQWGWRDGDVQWSYQQEWPDLNGHAGVGCYSWGPTGNTTYTMVVNTNNEVEFWWKDTNTNGTNTTTHPIGVWTRAAYTIPDVNPSTDLGYTNYFYAQTSDNYVYGYNITWAAENTAINGVPFLVGTGDPAISGTRISVSTVPNAGGGNSIVVFLQTVGNQITEYIRDLYTGQWSEYTLPIA